MLNLESVDWLDCKLDFSLGGSHKYIAGPIYQIFPDRFYCSSSLQPHSEPDYTLESWSSKPTVHGFKGGNLWGVAAKVDYIASLGIKTVYLNPIFLSPANHRYHTQDYFTVDPMLGGMEAFVYLQNKLAQKGIDLWLDGVFNHAARSHFAFASLLECGKKSPYINWFYVKGFPLRAFSKKPNYDCWWGLAALPKWNTNHPAVREHLMQAAEFWVKKGISGWRLDVPNEIDDDAFWLELVARCKKINPEVVFVGEIWDHPARWVQEGMFEGVTHYRMYRLIRKYFCNQNKITPDSIKDFVLELQNLLNDTPRALQQVNLLGSHDTSRIASAIYNPDLLRGLFAFLFFLPGVPLIFSGDEMAMTGGKDPDCRKGLEWNTKKWNKDFTKDFAWFSKLRSQYRAIFMGSFQISWNEGALLIKRVLEDKELLLIWNVCSDVVGFNQQDGSLLELKSTEFAIIEPVI